jgi:hypothetical protein
MPPYRPFVRTSRACRVETDLQKVHKQGLAWSKPYIEDQFAADGQLGSMGSIRLRPDYFSARYQQGGLLEWEKLASVALCACVFVAATLLLDDG